MKQKKLFIKLLGPESPVPFKLNLSPVASVSPLIAIVNTRALTGATAGVIKFEIVAVSPNVEMSKPVYKLTFLIGYELSRYTTTNAHPTPVPCVGGFAVGTLSTK